ncbi:MAG TPA: DNA translocase FtsK 4TM domain-containing protein, partial [Sedimentisphaerales bacterium]
MPITRSKKPLGKPSPRSGKRGLPDPEFEPVSVSMRPRKPRKSSKSSVPPDRFSVLDGIPPERQMDILGVVLAIVGLVTLLSLFSATKSSLTGSWINILAQVFGWGDYILPVALLVLGVWLVARNVDRLPALNIERLTGLLLLFIGLLAAFHGIDGPTATAYARAMAGQGGGLIGYLLQTGLVGAIGAAGTVIVVVAWLLIAMALTLDLSMQDM